jgi:hypothetical protein
MKVTDNRKITIELGGHKHKLTFDEAKELYHELGLISGIGGPCRISYGGGIISSGSTYTVGERGPELVVNKASIESASRWVAEQGDDGPDEDDPPMAVAV